MNPYVKSAKPQKDYCLLLTFVNGEKRHFDLKPYLEKPIFKQLKNMAIFKTARVVSGSVEWQGEIDLSYDTLYLESKPIGQISSPHKAAGVKKKIVTIAGIPRKKSPRPRITIK